MNNGFVHAAAQAWGRWQRTRDFPFRADHCINGTRVVTEALRGLGVDAHPLSVSLLVFNQQAWDLYRAGIGVDDWPAQAWSVGVGPPSLDAKVSSGADGRERFKGHLVAEGEGWTLDVSARQFARPGLITVARPILLWENVPRQGYGTYTDENHNTLLIRRWRANDGWKQAPGWTRPHSEEVAELTRRIYALL